MLDLQSSITAYFEYFENQYSFLANLDSYLTIPAGPVEDYIEKHNLKVILASSYIDALASIRYSGSPSVRFKLALEESGLPQWCLVSISVVRWAIYNPGLFAHLHNLPDSLNVLRTRPEWQPNADQNVEAVPWASRCTNFDAIYPAENFDKDMSATVDLLQRNGYKVDSYCQRVLDNSTYSSIFYREYRSALVHEAKIGAGGFGWNRVAIPDSFVLESFKRIIGNVNQYCESNAINPFDLIPSPHEGEISRP